MAKDEEKNGTMLGEISTIRNILMGQQMSEYEDRFLELQGQVKQSEIKMNQRLDKMQADMNSQFNGLEEKLKQYMEALNNKIAQTSDQDRINLGNLLAELSNQLLNKK